MEKIPGESIDLAMCWDRSPAYTTAVTVLGGLKVEESRVVQTGESEMRKTLGP